MVSAFEVIVALLRARSPASPAHTHQSCISQVATRIIGFGVTLLAPMAVLGVTVLLPINYVDDYYETSARANDLTDRFTSVFSRLTMSNIRPGSPLMWIHFTMVYVFVGWTCWLTVEYYKEYIVIRQAYLVNVGLGG